MIHFVEFNLSIKTHHRPEMEEARLDLIKETLLQLFFALMPFVIFNVYYRDKSHVYSENFIMLACSACLILSMTFAVGVKPGIFFDTRYIITFFGLLFGGLNTGMLLLGEFVIYRFFLGGDGKWIGILIMIGIFPLLVVLSRIYQKSNRKQLSLFFAGIMLSSIPFISTYFYFDSGYFVSELTFHVLILPVFNSVGIWLLVSLFNKSVSDKQLYIQYGETEKVKAVSHVAASLVHEVRNPLTAVKGFLRLIQQGNAQKHKVEQYIAISIEEIERTESILNEYLSLAKPLTSKRKQTDVSLKLQLISDIMTPYANMNNVEMLVERPSYPVWIRANPEEIKQILINFVKNAIEACTQVPQGAVTVRLKQECKDVLLSIEDNGIGMNAEQTRRLGSIYFSTKMTGTGLGLTYSYQVIRALGGAVSVKSQPSTGTAFTIMLPLLIQEKAAPALTTAEYR